MHIKWINVVLEIRCDTFPLFVIAGNSKQQNTVLLIVFEMKTKLFSRNKHWMPKTIDRNCI